MNLKQKLSSLSRAQIILLLLAPLTLAAMLLRTLALFCSFDAEIGYFQASAGLVIGFYVCAGLATLTCLLIPFLINIKSNISQSGVLSHVRFVGAAIAAATLCSCAVFLVFCRNTLPVPVILSLVGALLLMLGACYFANRLVTHATNATVWLGYATILCALIPLIISYFDRYTQMNAPHKFSIHVCMLAVTFAVLFELRDLLQRSMPRVCTAVTYFTAFLCLSLSLPNLIAFLGGVYDSPTYLFFDLVALGFGAYFATKSVELAFLHPHEQEVSE